MKAARADPSVSLHSRSFPLYDQDASQALGIAMQSSGSLRGFFRPERIFCRGVERRAIRQALQAEGFNHARAAKRLRISRQTLLNKIQSYGLERSRGTE